MSDPLTPDRLEEIRRRMTLGGETTPAGVPLALYLERDGLALLAEVDRLRAVIDRAYAALEDGRHEDVPFILRPDEEAR